jgi:hypothetical protein
LFLFLYVDIGMCNVVVLFFFTPWRSGIAQKKCKAKMKILTR